MHEKSSIGHDLANHAAERASKAMRDALSLCETKQEALMVAIKVFATISGGACGVVAAHLGVDAKDVKPEEVFPALIEMARESRAALKGEEK